MSAETMFPLGPIKWISEPSRPPDFGGPVDVAYEPLVADCDGFELVERAARNRPDKVAVWDERLALTYAELLDRAYGLAETVAALVPVGGVVASVIRNGPAATAALLAVFGSGRTYVPIDANHLPERQDLLLAESGAIAVIVEAGESERLSALNDVAVIRFDVGRQSGAPKFDSREVGKSARFVTFTSGSTGAPKGIAFAASNKVVGSFVDSNHLNANDVFASMASMSTTGAADLVALIVGASIRVIDMRRIGIPESLKAFAEARITFLSFVPSALRSFMAVPGIESVFSSLRVLNLHGERILPDDLALFQSKLPKACRISITYGTMETSAVFSWFYRPEAVRGTSAPVGYIVPGKQVAVLAADGRPARKGEVGELVVRGEVALGSWQKGRLTMSRFLQDPDNPSARIYVTGDLVVQRDDDLFEFVGRKDRQVKIRGLLADLGAIEAVLRSSAGVDDAVVLIHTSPEGVDEIIAFVTPAVPEQKPDLTGLWQAVATQCAPYMAPSIIRIVPTIPRLSNYKPDLLSLEAMLGS